MIMRPKTIVGDFAATPRSAEEIKREGAGFVHGGVAFSEDQFRELWEAYLPDGDPLCPGDAGLFARNVAIDGLRVMAFLSRFLKPEDDPVRVAVELAESSGSDASEEDEGWDGEGHVIAPRTTKGYRKEPAGAWQSCKCGAVSVDGEQGPGVKIGPWKCLACGDSGPGTL